MSQNNPALAPSASVLSRRAFFFVFLYLINSPTHQLNLIAYAPQKAIFSLTLMQTFKHTARWFVLLAFLPSFAVADEAFELSLYTEVTQIQRGQPFELSVSLKQASDRPLLQIGDLSLHNMGGFQEIGQSTSVNTQVLNGKTAFFAELAF